MTQGDAIEAFLKALDDLVKNHIYQHADDCHSYYFEIANAKMRMTGALCVLLSGSGE